MPNEGYNENITNLDVIPEEKDLIIDGTPLSSFGVIVTREHGWDVPERDIDVYDVPGRNGALVIDNNKYKNITITYKCSILYDAKDRIRNLISFLYSDFGYRTIEDGWVPGYFRQGRIITPLSLELYAARAYDTANFELSFDCKPQKWLLSGGDIIPLSYAVSGAMHWITDDIKKITIKPTVNAGAYSPHASIEVNITGTDIDTGITGVTTIILPEAYGYPTDLYEYPEIEVVGKKDITELSIKNLDTDENGMEVRINNALVYAEGYNLWGNITNESAKIAKPTIIFNEAALFGDSSTLHTVSVWHEDDNTTDRMYLQEGLGGDDAGDIYIDTENYRFYRNYGRADQTTLSWTNTLPTLHPGRNRITIDSSTSSRENIRVKINAWEV